MIERFTVNVNGAKLHVARELAPERLDGFMEKFQKPGNLEGVVNHFPHREDLDRAATEIAAFSDRVEN